MVVAGDERVSKVRRRRLDILYMHIILQVS